MISPITMPTIRTKRKMWTGWPRRLERNQRKKIRPPRIGRAMTMKIWITPSLHCALRGGYDHWIDNSEMVHNRYLLHMFMYLEFFYQPTSNMYSESSINQLPVMLHALRIHLLILILSHSHFNILPVYTSYHPNNP